MPKALHLTRHDIKKRQIQTFIMLLFVSDCWHPGLGNRVDEQFRGEDQHLIHESMVIFD